MNIEELAAKLEVLEHEVRTLKDIEEIKTLQKAYGYYIEHWMSQEIIDLFADGSDVSLTLGAGTYLGKEGVIKYFERMQDPSPEFLHQVMQVSGIVDVEVDNNTAKGRWYGFGAVALPSDKGVRQFFVSGIYNSEYIKEDGKWKFKKLQFDQLYVSTPGKGWVQPDRVAVAPHQSTLPSLEADIPRSNNPRYPSGYIVPFHYKHPVTGKETSEEKRNASR